MNNVASAFSHGKAFIPFITAGDPDLETTEALVLAMAEAGAGLVELGIPFSDPVAEGPVIQRASLRALEAGTTTDRIFDCIRRIRQTCAVPLALMTYLNPVFVYGTQRFLENCRDCGVCAVIVPDLPHEEKAELAPCCAAAGVSLISLIAPTSHDRIRRIAGDAEGFIYCVSSMGVTGVRGEITSDAARMVDMVKQVRDIPCAVGFGISTPQQAAEIARFADGVIVGSAVVKLVEQYGAGSAEPVGAYVKAMAAALRG